MSTSPGHLFIVHGRIESVRHDFVIIPTSSSFSVRQHWHAVIRHPIDRARPSQWLTDTPEFAPSPATRRLWFLSVSGLATDRTASLVDRVCRLVATIASDTSAARIERPKPLIAVPVVGIDGGGLGNDRGRLVRKLIKGLRESAAVHDVDIALVTPDASLYAAAQHIRRRASDSWHLDAGLTRRAQELGHLAREGNLALFIGAGVGVGAGLPGWTELLTQIAKRRGRSPLPRRELESLPPLDQAQLLGLGDETGIGEEIKRVIGRRTTPSLAHALLASLGCEQAVTTNFDQLYERAVDATGGHVTVVLPQDSVTGRSRWVLKMHGDITRPEGIIISREQFVRYDATARPSAAMLQALFMTRHVLVFGASMTDDNVIRLAYEVNEYRTRAGHTMPYGSIVAVGAHALMERLWSQQLNWLGMPGVTPGEQGRVAEIFLDALGCFATADSSWLLDARFQQLTRMDQHLAGRARELYRDLPDDPMWEPLRASLESLGADRDMDPERRRRRRE